jgi:hypothetical protein
MLLFIFVACSFFPVRMRHMRRTHTLRLKFSAVAPLCRAASGLHVLLRSATLFPLPPSLLPSLSLSLSLSPSLPPSPPSPPSLSLSLSLYLAVPPLAATVQLEFKNLEGRDTPPPVWSHVAAHTFAVPSASVFVRLYWLLC